MSKHSSFTPEEVKAAIESNRAILVDVREPEEAAAERIPGAILCPLSTLKPGMLPSGDDRDIILHCKSGMRSGLAAEQCLDAEVKIAGDMKGGILAWKAAGFETVAAEDKSGMTIPQAVMATAGSFVLISMLMSLAFGPLWLLLGAAPSFMLIQAAFTGFCPAGKLFAAMGLRPA